MLAMRMSDNFNSLLYKSTTYSNVVKVLGVREVVSYGCVTWGERAWTRCHCIDGGFTALIAMYNTLW